MTSASGSAPRSSLSPVHDYLECPPAILCPDRATFARVLASATRNISVARRHENSDGTSPGPSSWSTDRRYELAYPLYLSAATDFLWCCRNLSHAHAQAAQTGGDDATRQTSLREKLMSQARKAMQRAEKIREVKGSQWAKRWGGGGQEGRRHAQVENQAKVLRESSRVNDLAVEPWMPGMERGPTHPLPELSKEQVEGGAHFQRPQKASLSIPAGSGSLRGQSITQDAITNCGLVAALEVIAEHDHRRDTSLLHRPLCHSDQAKEVGEPGPSSLSSSTSSSPPVYAVRLHYNGCLRRILVDDQLPHWSNGELMCASVSSNLSCSSSMSSTIILPALIEKAYLTILRTYAPQGSVPAEDLHVLTGWVPEVVNLPGDVDVSSGGASLSTSTSFQREKTWQRLFRSWKQGTVLICAGTRGSASMEQQRRRFVGTGDALIPGHSYALLDMVEGPEGRTITLMNPWRPSTAATSSQSSLSSSIQGLLSISWDEFCSRFATLHLAWDPTSLFANVAEVHARWSATGSRPDKEDGTPDRKSPIVVRNVELALTVTQKSQGEHAVGNEEEQRHEGAAEVWLHLSRHLQSTSSSRGRTYIALHLFEDSSSSSGTTAASRVLPINADRTGRSDYVSSSHHLVRFKPSFLAPMVMKNEAPGVSHLAEEVSKRYTVVVALHQESMPGIDVAQEKGAAKDGEQSNEDNDERFTLRAWSSSSHSVTLSDIHDDSESSAPSWSETLSSSWTPGYSSGGHRLCPSYQLNPQYLLAVPANTPQGAEVRITLKTSPPVPCHLCLAYSPTPGEADDTSLVRRVDSIDSPASLVAHSGEYATGMTQLRARLPGTGPRKAGLYVLVPSSFAPGIEADFEARLECPQMRVIAAKRAWTGSSGAGAESAISVHPIPPEGAGMFAKVVKGQWSEVEGTAAGPPNRGRYYDNPTWEVELPAAEVGAGAKASKAVRGVFRLLADSQGPAQGDGEDEGPSEALALSLGGLSLEGRNDTAAPLRYPATNLSLFSMPTNSDPDVPPEPSHLTLRATSGPYHSSPAGSALHCVRLTRGSRYRIVASQWEAGEGTFELKGWCEERGWVMRRLR